MLSLLAERRSLRVYDDRPVPEDVKREILQAAISAPTAGGLLLYAIIEITDQQLKDALSHTCDEQPFIAKAPWILLFAADYQRLWNGWQAEGHSPKRKPGTGDLYIACCDAIIAAQTAVVAAEALGLGSCYIGDIVENAEKQRELLALPDYVFPAAMLCFGYPRADDARKHTPRLPLETMVHRDRYTHKDWLTDDTARKLCASGLKKFDMGFSVEMTRSMNVWLEKWGRQV